MNPSIALLILTGQNPGIQRNPTKAVRLYEKACIKNEELNACFNLAVIFKNGDGEVLANKEKAAYYKARTNELLRLKGWKQLD
jgi:TPR repeat protein